MKRTALIFAFFVLFCTFAGGQTLADNDTIPDPAVNTALSGKSIFNLLRTDSFGHGKVEISQPTAVQTAMNHHIAGNSSRKMQGYRVRIFFDNKQTARTQSEKVMGEFHSAYPKMSVYREYENPYFKVTVGNFRTKTDAIRFLNTIKGTYPSGFVVKENIEYPQY